MKVLFSVLTALQVPDLGDLIFFSLASRCLSASCSMSFESKSILEFSTVNVLLHLFKRVSLSFSKYRALLVNRLYSLPNLRTDHLPKWSCKMDRPSPTPLVSSTPVPSPSPHKLLCKYWNNSHVLDVCRKFSSLPADERMKWVRARGICFSCFISDYWALRCTTYTKFSVCSSHHLHSNVKDVTPSSEVKPSDVSTSLRSEQGSLSAVLGVTLVYISDRFRTFQVAHTLIDSASQINVILLPCAERLGLRWSTWSTPISGLACSYGTMTGRWPCCVTFCVQTIRVLSPAVNNRSPITAFVGAARTG